MTTSSENSQNATASRYFRKPVFAVAPMIDWTIIGNFPIKTMSSFCL